MEKLTKRRALTLGLVGLIATTYIVYKLVSGKQDEKGPKEKDKAISIAAKVDSLYAKTTALYIYAQGRVNNGNTIPLSATAQGYLRNGKNEFKNGSYFNKGEVIFSIQDRQSEYALMSRKSNFTKLLHSVLPEIEMDFKETYSKWLSYAKMLSTEAALPDIPAMEKKENLFLSSKGILSEYYSIKSEEERLKRMQVIAPFNGTLNNVQSQQGAFISPGAVLGSFLSSNDNEIVLSIPERKAQWLKKGMKTYLFYNNDTLQGEITRLGQTINPNTQSMDVFVSAPTEKLNPGSYLTAMVYIGEKQNICSLPKRAFDSNNGIYILQKDSTVTYQKIEVILDNDQFQYFISEKKAEVLIEPVDGIYPGMKINAIRD